MTTSPATSSRYTLPTIEPERVATLAERLQLSRPFAQLLLARGIDSSPVLKAFLHPRYTPEPDARNFHNGEALVDRLVEAIRNGEPILVHGDYDVDGISGTVIYRRALATLGAQIRSFLPSRFVDGYGVSSKAITSAHQKLGIRVVLTADTGSQAHDAIQVGNDAGIAMCITDHHELGARLPDTPWFINPRQSECSYPYKGLSGGGIAMKVVLAIGEALGKPLDPETLIPYATLSTIADVCPLTLENRAIVNQGLKLIQQPRDPGLRALVDFARKSGTALSARDLAFGIIPILNAAGRIDDPSAAAMLLLTDSATEARTRLADLQTLNEQRKRITDTVFEQAAQQAEQQLTRDSSLKALVVSGPQWHFGVVGIVAARLVDRYGLPTICLTQHQDQQRHPDNATFLYTGSGRAPDGIALLTAVQQCRAEIEHCGGHEAALGIGIHEGSIIAFRERLSAAVAALPPSTHPPRTLDGRLDPADISPQLLGELARVEPCGAGNPSPRFLIGPFEVEDETGMKGNAHRSLGVHDARGTTWRAVQFNVRPGTPIPGGPIGIIGTPVLNKWKGSSKIELSIEDLIAWPAQE